MTCFWRVALRLQQTIESLNIVYTGQQCLNRIFLCFCCRFWDPRRWSREVDDSWGDCTVHCRQEGRLWIICSIAQTTGKCDLTPFITFIVRWVVIVLLIKGNIFSFRDVDCSVITPTSTPGSTFPSVSTIVHTNDIGISIFCSTIFKMTICSESLELKLNVKRDYFSFFASSSSSLWFWCIISNSSINTRLVALCQTCDIFKCQVKFTEFCHDCISVELLQMFFSLKFMNCSIKQSHFNIFQVVVLQEVCSMCRWATAALH